MTYCTNMYRSTKRFCGVPLFWIILHITAVQVPLKFSLNRWDLEKFWNETNPKEASLKHPAVESYEKTQHPRSVSWNLKKNPWKRRFRDFGNHHKFNFQVINLQRSILKFSKYSTSEFSSKSSTASKPVMPGMSLSSKTRSGKSCCLTLFQTEDWTGCSKTPATTTDDRWFRVQKSNDQTTEWMWTIHV